MFDLKEAWKTKCQNWRETVEQRMSELERTLEGSEQSVEETLHLESDTQVQIPALSLRTGVTWRKSFHPPNP